MGGLPLVDVEVLDWTALALVGRYLLAAGPPGGGQFIEVLALGDVVRIPIGGGQAGQGGDFLEDRVRFLMSAPLRGAQGLRCGQVRPISP